jgi:hypothetical protein
MDRIVLRAEVETGTTLTQGAEVRAIPSREWKRKRFCEYDAIRHDLGRLSQTERAESQRLCRQAQEAAGLAEPAGETDNRAAASTDIQ